MKHRYKRSALAVAVSATVVIAVQQLPQAFAAAVVQPASVTIAGDLDSELGCTSDWLPSCAATHLALRPDGIWAGTFTLPAGSFQYKAALNDTFDVSYGLGGGAGNISLVVPAANTQVTFYFDPVSHWVTDSVNTPIVTAVGDFQTALGCAANNDPQCLGSWLEDLDGDATFSLTTRVLPAGTYQVQAAVGGALVGTAQSFTVPPGGGGSTTTISYVTSTGLLTVSAVPLVQGPPAAFSHPTARRGDVIANLFEWNWTSVANECATVLGPAGYGGVQVAPPQNSLSKTDGPVHPWWEVYQPVDYNLTSRMGNEAQFTSMVTACRTAGVKVYVDTVINHMEGTPGASYGGATTTDKYTYPGLYSNADFHHYPADCPVAGGVISDFNSYQQVTKCELVGLSDLRTESESVRTTIAGYLNKLLSYGVSGFRVDAAKHIGQTDLAAIEAKLNRTVDGTRPYIALEVSSGGPGKLTAQAFQGQGSLLGFDFSAQILATFTSDITNLSFFGEAAGLLPSKKSLAFVENHDTERNGQTLSYKSGATNTLATEFMLAYGYGTPQVYAGFVFAASDDSPPSDANGMVTDTNCDIGWACTHRSIGVANMVDWHNFAKGAKVANWYDDGTNLIAFSRGHRAWIAINNESAPKTITVKTGLRQGVYCDIIHGTYSVNRGGACTGPTVRVGAGGQATVTVPAKDSVAFNAHNTVRQS